MNTLPTKEALVAEGTAALEDLPTDMLISAIHILKAIRTSIESTEVKIAIGDLMKAGGWGTVVLKYQGGRLVGADYMVKKRF